MVKLNDILQDLQDYRPALGAVSARADGWRRWVDGRAAYIRKVRGLSASAAKQEAPMGTRRVGEQMSWEPGPKKPLVMKGQLLLGCY